MNEKINHYVNNLFEPYDRTKSVTELKSDMLADLNERFEELTSQGKDEEAALAETLNSIGDIEETLGEMASLTHTLERQLLVNFSAQNLKGSDFAGVTLHGGKFGASTMEGADFSGADLTGSSFKSSDLRGTNFNGANLTDCNFTTLDLSGVSFRESIMVRTNFNKVLLTGVKFIRIKLKDVNFSMVDLRDVSFDGCVIDGGEFKYTDLRGQHFDGMTLRNVKLGKAALECVSFHKATLHNVSFTPPFALTNKYYSAIKTIQFDGSSMDKLTYNALKGSGANLLNVTII
ncbi:MAG TPA: pentapeptide repeat-containing protein [Lachnoclostridium phytofermentans]|uniref:Pentapeptide repeat-containing protein n=2 Tax=Lachnoclostridium TaxID=1506553 RepID=A0A3D2X170_9FIRM|nr:pentapeptide repeat-containing protein [Lachnoclostridium phytofermentans]